MAKPLIREVVYSVTGNIALLCLLNNENSQYSKLLVNILLWMWHRYSLYIDGYIHVYLFSCVLK